MKLVNYNHIMPTRYQLDVDLKAVVTADKLENSTKKLETRKVSEVLRNGQSAIDSHVCFDDIHSSLFPSTSIPAGLEEDF